MAAVFKRQLKTRNSIPFSNQNKDLCLVIHSSRNTHAKYLIKEEILFSNGGRKLRILRGITSALYIPSLPLCNVVSILTMYCYHIVWFVPNYGSLDFEVRQM